MLQAAELQTSLQQVILSSGVPAHIKDRFAELLSLVENDTEEVIQTTRAGSASRSSRQEAGDGLGVGSSKGGHSLRNLDSRRAAEVSYVGQLILGGGFNVTRNAKLLFH